MPQNLLQKAARPIVRALRRNGIELVRRQAAKPYHLRGKRQSLELLRSLGFSPDLVIDIGVAYGTDGLYGVWPEARYVLIEPLAKFERHLIEICRSCCRSEYHIAAAGEAAGELTIASNPAELHTVRPADSAPENWVRTSVPVVTADSYLLPGDRQILLKVDVDGPELTVLRGASEILARDGVIVIEAALLDEDRSRFGAIMEFMLQSRYECFDVIEPMYRFDDVLWQVDLVFVRRESPYRSNRHFYVTALSDR